MPRNKISYSASLIALKAWILSQQSWATHLESDRNRFAKAIPLLPLLFRVLARLFRIDGLKNLASSLNEKTIPGELGQIYVRKHFTKEWVKDSKTDNLIILGGGFDTLLLDSVVGKFRKIIEIDSKSMIAKKRSLLNQNGVSKVIFGHDITNDAIWEVIPKGESVLVISEGFWEYVPETALNNLFDSLFSRFSNIELVGTLYDFLNMDSKVRDNFVRWTSRFGEHLVLENDTQRIKHQLCAHNLIMQDEVNAEKMRSFFSEHHLPLSVWKQFSLARWTRQ